MNRFRFFFSAYKHHATEYYFATSYSLTDELIPNLFTLNGYQLN